MTAYLDAIDPATWARAIAYVAIFMMCLFVSMEWRRGLRFLALAGMYYCVARIVTTVLNALRVAESWGRLQIIQGQGPPLRIKRNPSIQWHLSQGWSPALQ